MDHSNPSTNPIAFSPDQRTIEIQNDPFFSNFYRSDANQANFAPYDPFMTPGVRPQVHERERVTQKNVDDNNFMERQRVNDFSETGEIQIAQVFQEPRPSPRFENMHSHRQERQYSAPRDQHPDIQSHRQSNQAPCIEIEITSQNEEFHQRQNHVQSPRRNDFPTFQLFNQQSTGASGQRVEEQQQQSQARNLIKIERDDGYQNNSQSVRFESQKQVQQMQNTPWFQNRQVQQPPQHLPQLPPQQPPQQTQPQNQAPLHVQPATYQPIINQQPTFTQPVPSFSPPTSSCPPVQQPPSQPSQPHPQSQPHPITHPQPQPLGLGPNLSQYPNIFHPSHQHPQPTINLALPPILPIMPTNLTSEQLIQTHPWSIVPNNPNEILQSHVDTKPIQSQLAETLVQGHFAIMQMFQDLREVEKRLPEDQDFSKNAYKNEGEIVPLDLKVIFAKNEAKSEERSQDWLDEHGNVHYGKSYNENYNENDEDQDYIHTQKIIDEPQQTPFKAAINQWVNKRRPKYEKRYYDNLNNEKQKLRQRQRTCGAENRQTKPTVPNHKKPANEQPSKKKVSFNLSPESPSTDDKSSGSKDHSPNSPFSSGHTWRPIGSKRQQQTRVSEFKITKHEKPFTKKYTIKVNSNEEHWWKWVQYRINNGIKWNYSGEVSFEKFTSYQATIHGLVKDLILRNPQVEKFFTKENPCLAKIYSLETFRNEAFDTDLIGELTLPLRLKLPQGYKYSYWKYQNNTVTDLRVQNEFTCLQFKEPLQFKPRSESQRDWRKKIQLNRTSVWIGDQLLRKNFQVTFLKPTSSQVLVEGNHGSNIVAQLREPYPYESQKMRQKLGYGHKDFQVTRTVYWERVPRFMKARHLVKNHLFEVSVVMSVVLLILSSIWSLLEYIF